MPTRVRQASSVRLVAVAFLIGSGGFSAACQRDPIAAKARYVRSGDAYAGAGKYAEAAIEYRNALQQDPLAGDVREKLGRAFLRTGNFTGALGEYVRAADLRPNDHRLQLEAGNLLLLAGRFEDAKARAEGLLAADGRNVDAQILEANALAALKNVDAAVTQIEDALRVDSNRSRTYASLGALELTRGNRDAAEGAFTKAVALAPDSVVARLALGNFYWLTGRSSAAEESLRRALDLEPRNPLTNRALASFYLATGRPESAEKPLLTVYDISRSPETALKLADYYVSMGRDEAASQVLQRLLSEPATVTTASVGLAFLEFKTGRRDESRRRVRTVLDREPDNLQALLLYGAILADQGALDEALTSARLATERHSDSAAAFFLLGRVQTARRQSDAAVAAFEEVIRLNPRASEAKVALARLHLDHGRPGTALTFAREALAREPSNGDAAFVVARALVAEGELERASAAVADLARRYPNSAAVHGLKGTLLARKHDDGAARSEFELAMRLKPDAFEPFSSLVALDLGSGDFARARARVDARLDSPAPRAPLLVLAANVYAATGDSAAAERFLRRAIEADSEYLQAYGTLGQLYMKQHKLDAARAEFDGLAQHQSKPVEALTMAGMLLQAQGDLNGARERFERVMQLDPEAGVAANNLAWIYAQHGGNLDVALQYAHTAQKRLPGVTQVGDTLGFIYYKKDLAPLAVSTLRTVAAREPSNPVFQYHLGLAYAGAGDTSRAREALERALMLKKDFSGSQDARKVLDSLRSR